MFGTKDKRLSILDRFFKTEIGQELLAQEEQELQGQRDHAARVIATVEREQAETLPKLAKATADARLALTRAKQGVIEAQEQLTLCEVTEIDMAGRLERETATARAFLYDSTPECVQAYLSELLAFYSTIRHPNTVLPELKPDEIAGSFSGGYEQRKKLDARWQHTQTVNEFHQLVRDTITLVKQMFGQPITTEQAAKEVESHRRVIAKAQKAAGIVL